MTGIILAAGDGTRFSKSSGIQCCKVLQRVKDKYLLEYSLNNLVVLGITEVFIVVGKMGSLIRENIGNEYKGVKINYVVQQKQVGLVDALSIALDSMNRNDDIILQLADEIFIDFHTDAISKLILENKFDFYCGVTYEGDREKIKSNFSVETDESMMIKHCAEKPKIVTNNIKGTGFCIFNKASIDLLKKEYNKYSLYDLCDYINFLVENKKNGIAFHVAEKEFNINTFSDLKVAIDTIGELEMK